MQNDIADIEKMLVRTLENYFGTDEKRIEHARRVLTYARELLKEEQADPYVVIPAAILHDVGIKIAEEKYGSAAPEHQEKEGPPVAGKMLVEMGYEDENIYEICAIIAHHHTPGTHESSNYKVVYDADWLENFDEVYDIPDKDERAKTIDKTFLTAAGRKMAQSIFLR